MAPRTQRTNPQTREWTPENDCCNRLKQEQAHSRGCINNPVNVKPDPKAGPDKGGSQRPPMRERHEWVKFTSRSRTYVEGALLEDSGQEITLSPAAAYRQRLNKNLTLVEGVIPTLPDGAPERPDKNAPLAERQKFQEYETAFIDSLEDGDPKVGGVPGPKETLTNAAGKQLAAK